MITSPAPMLLWLLGGLFGSLVIGSLARWVSLRGAEEERRRKRLASLRTWWMIFLLVGACLLVGRLGVCLLLTIAGLLAFREYAELLGISKTERPAVRAAYAIAVVNFLLILFDQGAGFVVFVPLVSPAILSVVQVLQGRAGGYIRTTGGIYWGMMVLFYGIGHAAYLFIHPASASGPVGPAGWFLYLLILTEGNDIFQALVGRSIGEHKRHRIAPTLSPNKTWEGFVGGAAATLILAVVLAPWLTTLDQAPGAMGLPEQWQQWVGPLVFGAVVAVAGFFGDINMSGIKRDSGVKDSGHLLPGMGGLVDRLDSLTFTAPAFVYLLQWWMR